MDLVAMAQTIRRYKFATVPIILLVGVLAFYAMFLTPPEYTATGSYILEAPPPAPTTEQIARDPALGKVNANDPLLSYGDLQVVGLMLSRESGTQAVEDKLLAEGVDPLSSVANDSVYGNAPLLDITGVGTTAAEAVRSGMLEGQTVVKLLNDIQAQMGVSPGYRITAYALDPPQQATLKTSSKLRDLIMVMVLGIIMLFVAVSVAKAREERKRERAAQAASAAGSRPAENGNGLPPGIGDQLDLGGAAHGLRRHSLRFPVREGDPDSV